MIEFLKILYLVLFILIALILLFIFLQKYHLKRLQNTEPSVRKYIFKKLERGPSESVDFNKFRIFKSIQDVGDQIILSRVEEERIYQDLFNDKDLKKLQKMATSIFPVRRVLAAHHLSYIPTKRSAFITMIKNESNPLVLFYMFYFSIHFMNQEIFEYVMQKVVGMERHIIDRFSTVISNHYDTFRDYLDDYNDININEHIYIKLQAAIKNNNYDLPDDIVFQLKKVILGDNTFNHALVISVLSYLETINDDCLSSEKILTSDSMEIRRFAYRAIARDKQWASVEKLFKHIGNQPQENQFIIDLIMDMTNEHEILNRLFYYEKHVTDHRIEDALAQILSEKITYLVLKLESSDHEMAINNLNVIIKHQYTAGLIAFINNNNDHSIEKKIMNYLNLNSHEKDASYQDFYVYIKADILKRYDIQQKAIITKPKGKPPLELSKVIWLLIILAIAIIFYPLLSLIEHFKMIDTYSSGLVFKNLIIDTNQNLIFYFLIGNGIYIFLMIISLFGSHKQNVLWDIKTNEMLYENDLLPPISIIAPAYNEEVNIITSVRSLLNLKYPKYEVIVVNDGSKDGTLNELIKYFDLKRRSPYIHMALATKDIRGIYLNPAYPNLIVVNKVNGGKADALNVGINVSNHPYICGIDADSVLDQDALLRLMSSSIDHKEKAIALGGNIVPANGCKIDYGYVEERHFPKEMLTRFQAVEYIRSFSSGRLGWSQLKGLLIISGAFGLFYKDDIIKIGGYITSSGSLKKDSVGEDMELVVRLTHQRMKEHKKSYIGYVYHANCYTELPSDRKTLLKQRNRWHRGLIDILNYHRHMSFNPKYKHIGLVVIPYFYIFEVLGPFFEWIGYAALLISFINGYLAGTIVAMIFGLSIILGIIISLLSLLIQESRTTYMTKKDTFYLILFSILENFGYRQVLSLHRIYSFFTAFFESGKWGEQKRKGI